MTRSNPFAVLHLCTSLEYNSAITNGCESRAATLLDGALSLHLQERQGVFY